MTTSKMGVILAALGVMLLPACGADEPDTVVEGKGTSVSGTGEPAGTSEQVAEGDGPTGSGVSEGGTPPAAEPESPTESTPALETVTVTETASAASPTEAPDPVTESEPAESVTENEPQESDTESEAQESVTESLPTIDPSVYEEEGLEETEELMTDLASAKIGSMCEQPPQQLRDFAMHKFRDGRGQGAINTLIPPVRHDVTGDGELDTIVVFNCDLGGAGWPDQIVIFDSEMTFLGSTFLEREGSTTESYVRAMKESPAGAKVTVDVTKAGARVGTRTWDVTFGEGEVYATEIR